MYNEEIDSARYYVETFLNGKPFISAEEIIDMLRDYYNEWTNVAFSPEEIILQTMSSDMCEIREDSFKFDVSLADENGAEFYYTVQITTYVKKGNEGSGDDDYCRTIRVYNEYEDVDSVKLLRKRHTVNTLKDLGDWMHEYIEQHEEEPVFPYETLQLVCERNGWEMSEDHLSITAEDGSVFPIIAKEFWKTAQSIEASPEEISIDYASTRRKECDDIAKDDFLDVYGYEEEDARNVLTCLYRYDQASVSRIIDEMNRNGWFDW